MNGVNVSGKKFSTLVLQEIMKTSKENLQVYIKGTIGMKSKSS